MFFPTPPQTFKNYNIKHLKNTSSKSDKKALSNVEAESTRGQTSNALNEALYLTAVVITRLLSAGILREILGSYCCADEVFFLL